MVSLVERCQSILNTIRQSPAQRPGIITIPLDHIEGEDFGKTFQPNEHYFQVYINEMFLKFDRKWFDVYSPMVFVVSEFIYGTGEEAVPFVIGPMMMEKYNQELPVNMVFSNTRVAGPHPYRGGTVGLAVVLYQVLREDDARNLLRMVENITSFLSVALPLSNYVKVASVALDGFESWMGRKENVPLIGERKEFDFDGDDKLKSGYFALIDIPETQLDASKFWVKEHRLMHGKTKEEAQPFKGANFVLYSIHQAAERHDLAVLPFYPLYQQVMKDANEPYQSVWERTKINMTSLAQTMLLSSDLTVDQAKKLTDTYTKEMADIHKKAVDRSVLAGPAAKPSPLDVKLRETLDIMKL